MILSRFWKPPHNPDAARIIFLCSGCGKSFDHYENAACHFLVHRKKHIDAKRMVWEKARVQSFMREDGGYVTTYDISSSYPEPERGRTVPA